MSGETLPLLSDAEPLPEAAFIVGVNAHTQAILKREGAGADLARAMEGWATKGMSCRRWARTWSSRAATCGAPHGVYDLLEEHYGCRWFTPTVSHIPSIDG